MASVSLAEQVARYVGPIERLVQQIYMMPPVEDRGELFSQVIRYLHELDMLAERRIDRTTYEHYRRARTEAADLTIPVQLPRG